MYLLVSDPRRMHIFTHRYTYIYNVTIHIDMHMCVDVLHAMHLHKYARKHQTHLRGSDKSSE